MSEEIYDPRERLEIFLNAIRTGDVEDLPDPQTREEMYLLAIASKSALPDPTDASVGDALLLDSDKKPVWSTIPTPESPKVYKHSIDVYILRTLSPAYRGHVYITLYSTSSTPLNSMGLVRNAIGEGGSIVNGFDSTNKKIAIRMTGGSTYFVLFSIVVSISDNNIIFTSEQATLSSTEVNVTDTVAEI